MRVVDPRKLHVSVYKNAQTIVSWLLPVLKGFYDTHAQLTSVWYIRKHCLAYFLYMETLTRMRVLQEDEICFTSKDAIFIIIIFILAYSGLHIILQLTG